MGSYVLKRLSTWLFLEREDTLGDGYGGDK